MPITEQEFYGRDGKPADLDSTTLHNVADLLARLNSFKSAYAKGMVVTSGFRSKARHAAIYKAKGVAPSAIPWGSRHLSGQACDFRDQDGALKRWVRDNEAVALTANGLWAEHWDATLGWLHLQSAPYKSWTEGKSRWFRP